MNGFPKDPVDSTTDHRGSYDDPQGHDPVSFQAMLSVSVARIQNSPVTPATGGSPPSDPERHDFAPRPPRRRDPARDAFGSPHTYCDAIRVQQHGLEWSLRPDNPYPIHGQVSVQGSPIVTASSWDNAISYPPAADSLRPGVISPQTSIQLPFLPQDGNPFASYPNHVSGGTKFPRWIQPDYVVSVTSATGTGQDQNQNQLSSGSQGPPLIANERYDSTTQHSTFTSGQLVGDPPFPPRAWTTMIPPRTWVTVIPQRPYARRGDREQQESIIFKVNGRSGILAKRAIGKAYAGLEGRDDQVFVGKSGVLMLRLEWPGYPAWARKIRLSNWKKSPERIRLEKLATEVAKCVERFTREAQATSGLDRDLSDWRVGAEFIEISQLVLVALDKVSKGSWQPRIGLLSQHQIDSSSTPFES